MSTTVKKYADNMCDTRGVLVLSRQIVDNLLLSRCTIPVATIGNLVNVTGASTIPMLQEEAAESLAAAIEEFGERPTLIHALRVLPQQYCLWTWYLQKRCKIPLAAPPGASPHEQGIAIDIRNYESWVPVLKRHGWKWGGKKDPAHFTFTKGHDPDLANEARKAFQRLWNLQADNEPKLVVDGHYGPKTTLALESSPIGGW